MSTTHKTPSNTEITFTKWKGQSWEVIINDEVVGLFTRATKSGDSYVYRFFSSEIWRDAEDCGVHKTTAEAKAAFVAGWN